METAIVSPFQYSLIYNAFSFTFATMAAATIYLWFGRSQVSSAYKNAVTISGLVTAIAAYHYFRIFESWESAYHYQNGVVTATGIAFNDAYRYVDWLLTVPLLLIELVLVMRLSREETVQKGWRLGLAAALMIVLGYPGEIAADIPTRALWGTLSAIPFVYIVWELFSGLGKSIDRQPEAVRGLVKQARLLTFASWGFYPIVYMAPYAQITGPEAQTVIQIGYTIADLVAKAGVGLLIFAIAQRKSEVEGHGTPHAA
ncbi:bacteriorhodopsin-like [uncultured Sphingomonas sp.]|uniref:bacteriorhodopsin-like n=1 Tax=uncultured Sphingomonas sp. TaxID=158754 RepID=UPI0025CD0541|nr:bacteriorhodopsin-like [uncultured Sphingomonas sp.]